MVLDIWHYCLTKPGSLSSIRVLISAFFVYERSIQISSYMKHCSLCIQMWLSVYILYLKAVFSSLFLYGCNNHLQWLSYGHILMVYLVLLSSAHHHITPPLGWKASSSWLILAPWLLVGERPTLDQSPVFVRPKIGSYYSTWWGWWEQWFLDVVGVHWIIANEPELYL